MYLVWLFSKEGIQGDFVCTAGLVELIAGLCFAAGLEDYSRISLWRKLGSGWLNRFMGETDRSRGFRDFLRDGVQEDWLGVTRGMFPGGSLRDGDSGGVVYEVSDSGRLISFSYSDDPDPKVSVEFSWESLDYESASKKDRVAYLYKSATGLRRGSLGFMRRLEGYFAGLKRIGVGVEISTADYMDAVPRRGRLFGKMLGRSGFEHSGVTLDKWSGDRHLYR
jgi:hypothetical protein